MDAETAVVEEVKCTEGDLETHVCIPQKKNYSDFEAKFSVKVIMYRKRNCVKFRTLDEAHTFSKTFSKYFGALCTVWEDKE